MAWQHDLGKKGEDLAVAHLQEQGYCILERNWRWGRAEVDVIAQKGDVLAVVEVKTRTSTGFGQPHEFVNAKKVRLLTVAIDQYITMRKSELSVRFDIISIVITGTKTELFHIKDAFLYF